MRTVALSDHAEIFNGKTPSKADQRELGHPVLKIRDVDELGQFRRNYESFVDPDFAQKFQTKQIKAGDTLILNAAHNADYVGSKTFFAGEEVEGAVATGEWLIVRPNSASLDARFASHWLTSSSARREIRELVKGIHLYPKDVARLAIPLPPLDEQKRIAAILDQADELRRKRQRAIDRLNHLGQAIFVEMFGDPVANPFDWPIQKLGEVGVLDRGISKHRPRNDPALLDGEHPLIQTGDVANADSYIRSFTSTYSDLGLKQSKKWPTGTLCITIAANIGKTAILEIEACFPDSVVGFTPSKETNAEYIQFWMSFIQKRLEEVAPQSAQKNINLAILRELPIPMPPRKSQDEFRSAIREIELHKANLWQSAESFGSLFAAVQHRAFQGEL
jgi:type I restriction enzyme S subunit